MAAASRDTETTIHFLLPEKFHLVDLPPVGTPVEEYIRRRDKVISPEKVTVLDATKAPGGMKSFDFDKHGFCEIPIPAPPVDFENRRLTRDKYLPMLEEVAKKASGALNAYAFQYLLRKEDRGRDFGSSYARFAHADYGPSSTPTIRQMLTERFGVPAAEAENLEVCTVNIWHPIHHPAFKDPFCLLDATSVAPGKEFDTAKVPFNINNMIGGIRDSDRPGLERVYKQGYFGQGNSLDPESSLIVAAKHNPTHRFYYCPDMTPEQGWLFKQWDSRENVARQSFHSSFRDPFHEADDKLPDRRSLECRLVITFPKEKPPSKL